MLYGPSRRLGRAGNSILSILLLSRYALSQDCSYSDASTLQSEMLCAHNGYRQRHQSPVAIYNQSMAQAAAAYTAQCIFEHPPLDNQGSNLAAGFTNSYDVVDAWYLEVNDPGYDFNNPGPINGTLHFTQLVWHDSVQIGCGASYCGGVNDVPGWYAACYYYPEGNVVLEGDEGYYFERNVFVNTSEAVASRFSCPDVPSVCASSTSSSLSTSSPISSATTSISSSSAIPLASSIIGGSSNAAGGLTLPATVITGSSSTVTVAPVVPTSNPIGVLTTYRFTNSSTSSPATSPATTSTTATGSLSSTTSSVIPIGTLVQLAFAVNAPARKRQNTVLQYVATGGSLTTDSTQGTIFNVVNNQLYSGNNLFSTNFGVPNQIFAPLSSAGTISTAFSLVNNVLAWSNPAFTINGNSQAQFAVLSSSMYAAFSALPPGATPVQLTALPAASSVTTSTTASGAIGTGTAAGGQTVIQATQATTISTDGIVFIVNPTGTQSPSTAVPTCPGVAPQYVMKGGGVINLLIQAPNVYGNFTAK